MIRFSVRRGRLKKSCALWCVPWRVLVVGFCLVGCQSFEPKLPEIQAPEASALWLEHSPTVNADPKAEVLVQWWAQFDDPLLSQWVSRAVANNHDVQKAWARLREVQLLTNATRSVRWPSLDLNASAARVKRTGDDNARNGSIASSNAENDFDLGLSADLPLDIFGQKRKQISGAQAQETIARAEIRATVLATISAVVTQYYRYRGLQKRIATTEQNTALLNESLKLITIRQKVGETSEFDVFRARGEYQFSRTRLPELQASLRATEHALAVLLGQRPGSLKAQLASPPVLPNVRNEVPLGARADLLLRRPDFLLAQAALEAELADFEVRIADLYPTFSLETFFGYSYDAMSQLLSSTHQRWSAGIFLDWPLFQIHTRREIAKAGRERVIAALLDYEAVALTGLAEVESAIGAYDAAIASHARLVEVVKSRQQTRRLVRALYEAGEEDYFAVIDAERELVARRDDLVVAETNTVLALTALYVALGGGWEVAVNE